MIAGAGEGLRWRTFGPPSAITGSAAATVIVNSGVQGAFLHL
jgi:hypothetical protein